jgi:hypothetical protein
MKKVAGMLRDKRDLILNWFVAEGRLSSGIVEGFNNKLKLVHPAEAYVDLQKRGHVGPICSCTKHFRQETPTCPQACCTMHSGFVTTGT